VELGFSQPINSKRYPLYDTTILIKIDKVGIRDMGELGRHTFIFADVIEFYKRDGEEIEDRRREALYTIEDFRTTPFKHTPTYYKEAQMVAQKVECYLDRAEELEKLDGSFMYRVFRSLCL
jgi:hypothetical protein